MGRDPETKRTLAQSFRGTYGARADKESRAVKKLEALEERLDLGHSVGSAASAAKLGDFFQYAIDKPVTLPRQKSAMLPIVAKEVEQTVLVSLGMDRRGAALGAAIVRARLLDDEAGRAVVVISAPIVVATNAEHVVQ